MLEMHIPYARQSIIKEDIEKVLEILQSPFLTQGPAVEQFERCIIDFCDVSYAVATGSATAALHVACIALGLKSGDYLWTSANTFVASSNCALYCGAKVDFVDIDETTYNMSTTDLEKKLVIADHNGILPKIVIPVHFAGQSCDMKEIFRLSKKYGFKIIEDASHAIGGRYNDKYIGCCHYSDITIFSFHPVKIITTGEGGMAVTNDKDMADKMRLLRSHGVTRDENKMQGESHGAWYYQQIDLGYNYRLTDIQAGLGVSQMKRIDKMVDKRNQIIKRYNKKLNSMSLILPKTNSYCYSSGHLYVVQVDGKWQNKRKELFDKLRSCGIWVNVHYIPVYLQPYYKVLGFKAGYCKKAEKYYSRAISLPIYYELSEEEQDYIVSKICNCEV